MMKHISTTARETLNNIRKTNLPMLSMYSTSSGFSQLLMMVYTILVARWLGPESYGGFVSCYVAATLSSILITWGMDTWLLRNASIHDSPKQIIGTVLRIKLVIGIPWVLVLTFLLNSLRPDIYPLILIIFVCSDIWIDSIANTLMVSLVATGRTKDSSILLILSRSARLIGAITLIAMSSQNVISFAIARLLVSFLIVLIGLIISKPAVISKMPSNGREIVRQSLSYGLSEFLAMVYGQVDVAMLSLLSNKINVGVYSPAVSMVNAVITVIGSIYTFYIPVLTQKYQMGKTIFLPAARNMMIGFVIIGILLSSTLALSAHGIVDLLLDSSYQKTGDLLTILSPILFLKSLSMGLAVWLVAINRQSKRLWPQGISTISNILLNLWVIPAFGVSGVAWVYVVSEAILTCGYTYWVIKSRRSL